jgi:hypothetical protein
MGEITTDAPNLPQTVRSLSAIPCGGEAPHRRISFVRQQRQHADEGGWLEHHDLRMGFREPAEQRHAARFRRGDLGYVLQEVEVFQVDGATAGVSRVRATTEVITCGITSRLNVCDPSTI